MVAEETIFVKILTPQKPFLVKEAVSVEFLRMKGLIWFCPVVRRL